MRRPAPYMYALGQAAREVALAMDPAFNKTLKDRDIRIGFEGRYLLYNSQALLE